MIALGPFEEPVLATSMRVRKGQKEQERGRGRLTEEEKKERRGIESREK